MKKILVLSIFPLFLFVFLGLLNYSHSVRAQGNDHVPGQILVKFKENTSQEEIDRQLNSHRANVTDKIDKLGVFVLRVPEIAQDKVLNALSKNPNVEFAEPDYYAEAFFTPNDTYFSNQWGLENTGQTIQGVPGKDDADIDASTAWDTTRGGVKVAILDTGIDQDHEDLSSQIVLNKDFTGSTSSFNDIYGHGTHVGGISAALTNNGKGVAGGCPNCQLMNGKVLNDSASGTYSWIASGIIWATDNGAKVINMSLGGSTSSKTLESAVNYAWNNGVVVVAAAGNSGNTSKTYPAAYTNAIAVAATDNQDKKAYFSEYGSWVDVAAPGENIFSTFPNHTFVLQTKYGRSQNYDFGSGTSMSTPMTSAVVALIWSTNKYTTASEVRSRLESTADKITGTGTYWSAGRINAATAVGDTIAPTPTPTSTITPTPTPKRGRNK